MLIFILSVIFLSILSIGGFYVFNNFFDWKGIVGAIIGPFSVIALLSIIIGSFVGAPGLDIYDIKTTKDFTKALTTDHSSVVIIYNQVPYVFEQYNVVNNFDAITNVVVAEKKNLYGMVLETEVQVLTPKNQPQ